MSARMRAADADRHEAADLLGQHVGSGRLTTFEYDERVQRVYAATYLDELDEMFEDLPARSKTAEVAQVEGSLRSALSGAHITSGSLTGKIRSAVTLPRIRQAYQRAPVATILAVIIALMALLVVLSVAVVVALYVVVPVLMIVLIVRLVRRRRTRRTS